MATLFAQQLRQIAAKSTNELDLRSRRAAYAESLIFERSVAAKQDWETLYQICIEGFQELCLLDKQFIDFERNLFGASSKDQDREQLNKSQNEALDGVLEQCLQILGSRLTLRPGIKVLEWLVRRFRIHVYNSGALLLTVFPYHEVQLFQNVLSIIPTQNLVDQWKFLRPYHQSPSLLPRHTLVYSASTNDGFFSALNRYALDCCQNGSPNPVFTRFWSGIVVEATAARLRQARSGRKEIQKQRSEDILVKILPLIDEGLSLQNCPEITIACFTIILVIASTRLFGDETIDSLMLAIAQTLPYTSTDVNQGLVCISILVTRKEAIILPRRVVNIIAKLEGLVSLLQNVKRQHSISHLLQALVQGTLVSIKQKDLEPKLSFLEKLLTEARSLCEESDQVRVLLGVVSHLHRLDQHDSLVSTVSSKIWAVLRGLHDSADYTSVFSQLAFLCKERGIEIEALLQTTLPDAEVPLEPTESIEENGLTVDGAGLESLVATLPASLESTDAYPLVQNTPTFNRLVQLLKLCDQQSAQVLVEGDSNLFSTLAIWKKSPGNRNLYISFLVRVACGPHLPSLKTIAIQHVSDHLQTRTAVNCQALLPYATVLLADSSQFVRRKAATLILTMEKVSDNHKGADANSYIALPEGPEAGGESMIGSVHLSKIFKHVYLPYLEECVSDGDQVHRILLQALNGNTAQTRSPAKQMDVDLKKPSRHDLFENLTEHALATPLLRVKLKIIDLLEGVGKVGPITKNDALRPILYEWLVLSPEESVRRAEAEELQLTNIDSTIAQLLSAQDRDAVIELVKTVDEQNLQPRPELIATLFERVASTWSGSKPGGQQSLTIVLFNMSFSENLTLARGARATLKEITLEKEALHAILEDSLARREVKHKDTSPSKKRKLNHSDNDQLQSPASTGLAHGTSRVVLALELADASKPESRLGLLPSLFDVLVSLRRQKGSESPYALSLCLNALLAIVDRAKQSRRTDFDQSSIRADVVIECIRHAESPQVQSDALLLSASLAELAPDRVIYHIMPVFTFMGSNMMSLDDGHSVNVVNQAIDRIIPPLVGKLKQQDEHNLIRSTTGLLSSFVAAFDHIPRHRRVKLYQRLLKRLGPRDFAFALSAMLTATKIGIESRYVFLVEVMGHFSPLEQLISYSKIIALVADVYSDKPHDADSLLHIDSSSSPTDRLETSLALFSLTEHLLRSQYLSLQLSKVAASDDGSKDAVQEQLKQNLQQVLETIRSLKPYGSSLANAAQTCMTALLQLLSLSQLIALLPDILREFQERDAALKPEALYILASQMRGKVPSDGTTASAALAYLADLEDILKSTDDDKLRTAVIVCIDRITEKYGRKDIDASIRIAAVLGNEAGTVAGHSSVQHLSVLTLSSIFEIVGEAAVPLVAETMSNALALIEGSLEEEKENAQLHDAAFTLVSTVVSNVPFMVSEEHLDRILTLTAEAAFSDLPRSCMDARKDALSTIARKIDLNTLIVSLCRTWEQVIENDIEAVVPTLDMCIQAIEHHSKSDIVKAADDIASFTMQVLDLRRVQLSIKDEESYSEEEVAQVEGILNDLTMKYIYKLNDSAFRPIFEAWIDWGVKCYDLSASDLLPKAKVLRQTSLFTLLTHFFDALKSIVTTYAAYIIAPANTILDSFANTEGHKDRVTPLSDTGSLLLYTTLLTLLTSTFQYDVDGFFTSPSHFQPLCRNLLAQLNLSAHKDFRPLISGHVIPAIVALATAVQDTPAHHMAINHALAQLRHSEHAQVRLASIGTYIAITEDEEVGDEWVSNVVSGITTAAVEGDGGKAGVGGSGETMIYVNEMLEDDDEDVEKEVRKWVRMVRERVGEEVFEF